MIAHPAEVSNPGPKFSGRAAAPPDQGSIRSAAVMGRMGRQGTPAARTPAGMSFVTTLPEAMTARLRWRRRASRGRRRRSRRRCPHGWDRRTPAPGPALPRPRGGRRCRIHTGGRPARCLKGHAAGVQNDAAVVHVEVPAHTDIPAVVAPEGRLNPQSFPSGAQQPGAAASGRIRCPPPDRPAD